jgi:hypothetical protein
MNFGTKDDVSSMTAPTATPNGPIRHIPAIAEGTDASLTTVELLSSDMAPLTESSR